MVLTGAEHGNFDLESVREAVTWARGSRKLPWDYQLAYKTMENLPETTSNPISQGCGPDTRINVQVSPTTGGDFFISIESNSTVENLKKLISKRLKVPRDRICLLFRDKWVFISKYSYFSFWWCCFICFQATSGGKSHSIWYYWRI